MELKMLDSTKKLKLPVEIFDCEYKESLIHQVVTSYLAGGRAGTHAQKTRAEVRGGGIKPWRQKGTGRARAGTIRSPLWRKGGVIFAAKPRCYQQKVNKKAYRVAICSIISELIRQERLVVVESFSLEQPKTKFFIKTINELLKELKLGKEKLLIISDKMDENVKLASRNLPMVELRESSNLDPVVLVNSDKVLVTKDALKQIEEWLT